MDATPLDGEKRDSERNDRSVSLRLPRFEVPSVGAFETSPFRARPSSPLRPEPVVVEPKRAVPNPSVPGLVVSQDNALPARVDPPPTVPIVAAPQAAPISHSAHQYVDVEDSRRALREALRLLYVALTLKLVIVVVELYGAAQSGSLAMLTDAVHLSIDVFAISAAIYAASLAIRPGNPHAPGSSPGEIIAVRINGAVLLIAGAELMLEAAERLGEPPELSGMGMAVTIAIVRLVLSLVTAHMLASRAKVNLNLKAVHMHATADMVSSAALILSAILVSATGVAAFDTLLSMAVATLILKNGWNLLAHSAAMAADLCPECSQRSRPG